MQTFPVTSSILSPTHLKDFLQEKYNLHTSVQCQLLKAGINHTYLVQTSENTFVFRVYSFLWRSELEIQEEIKLLNLLKEHKVSVSFPIVDTKGNYIQHISAPEGIRFGVFFSFATGEKIHHYANETHFAIGKLMAEFHQVSQNQNLHRIQYTPTVLLEDSIKKIASFLPENTAEMQILLSLQENYF
jgi:Ser/Thr protein kinase RdoA (MazF antagonist)